HTPATDIYALSLHDALPIWPSVGISVSRRTPAGIFARSSSTADTRPLSRYSRIFSAMDLPTLGISWSPLASRVDTSAWWPPTDRDRKSTRLKSSHVKISYAV